MPIRGVDVVVDCDEDNDDDDDNDGDDEDGDEEDGDDEEGDEGVDGDLGVRVNNPTNFFILTDN